MFVWPFMLNPWLLPAAYAYGALWLLQQPRPGSRP